MLYALRPPQPRSLSIFATPLGPGRSTLTFLVCKHCQINKSERPGWHYVGHASHESFRAWPAAWCLPRPCAGLQEPGDVLISLSPLHTFPSHPIPYRSRDCLSDPHGRQGLGRRVKGSHIVAACCVLSQRRKRGFPVPEQVLPTSTQRQHPFETVEQDIPIGLCAENHPLSLYTVPWCVMGRYILQAEPCASHDCPAMEVATLLPRCHVPLPGISFTHWRLGNNPQMEIQCIQYRCSLSLKTA